MNAMAEKESEFKIFLSAGLPGPGADEQTLLAIRDAVIALAEVVIPKAHLVWGGHPALNSLLRTVTSRLPLDIRRNTTIYQSDFFRNSFPDDISHFGNIKVELESFDQESSLDKMRKAMILSNRFIAGIFIGGDKGVIQEYNLFTKTHPNAVVIPIATTGGSAKLIAEESGIKLYPDDLSYHEQFEDLLNKITA